MQIVLRITILILFSLKIPSSKKSARFSVSWEIIWKNCSHKNHEFCREVLQVLRNFCGISVEFGGEKKAFSLHAVQDIVKAFSDFPYQQISVEWFLEKDLIHGLSEFWTWNWGLPKCKRKKLPHIEAWKELWKEPWKEPWNLKKRLYYSTHTSRWCRLSLQQAHRLRFGAKFSKSS